MNFRKIEAKEARESKPGPHQNESRVSQHKPRTSVRFFSTLLRASDPEGPLPPADSAGGNSPSALGADVQRGAKQDAALPLPFLHTGRALPTPSQPSPCSQWRPHIVTTCGARPAPPAEGRIQGVWAVNRAFSGDTNVQPG